MSKKRESWIDITKGLAILFVVMGHVVTSYHNSKLLLDAKIFNYICSLVYTFHMPLFFMVSGFLSRKSSSNGVLRKVTAYAFPYVIFSIVSFVLKFLAQSVVNTKAGIEDLLLIAIYPMSYLWFIYALLFVSVLQILLHKCIPINCSNRLRYGIMLTFSFILKLAIYIVSKLDMLYVLEGSFVVDICQYWFWYVLGEMLVAFFNPSLQSKINNISIIKVVLYTVLFMLLVWLLTTFSVDSLVVDMILSILGTALTVTWSLKISRSMVLEYMGRNTLPIYLLHGYVISAARIVLSKLGIPLLHGIVPLCFCSLISIVVSLFAYFISSKIPFCDFVFYPNKYIFRKNEKICKNNDKF